MKRYHIPYNLLLIALSKLIDAITMIFDNWYSFPVDCFYKMTMATVNSFLVISDVLVVGVYAELKILIISVSLVPIIYMLIKCLILIEQAFNGGNILGAWYKRNNFKKSTRSRKYNEGIIKILVFYHVSVNSVILL